jgi:integrase
VHYESLSRRPLLAGGSQLRWKILEKEVVDEVIFRTNKPRNRLILELMARGGMRIGEVISLTPADIEDRKLTLRCPKSGKEREIVFIPQKVADRLKEYITSKRIESGRRIFPIAAQSVYDALVSEGWSPELLPTVRTISNILNRHEYRLRTVAKTKVQKKR